MLYNVGKEDEGIHSIDIKGKTIVLMFEDKDDAVRYCGLLEAQDFPIPTIEEIEKTEIQTFCNDAGYESRYVNKGFLPETEEDRLLISPPERNLDEPEWYREDLSNINQDNNQGDKQLDEIRNKLEKLL
ncbi:hypothetical protein EV04_0267 [Prochlorococcus marinus str. LG]|nr:hypothetical protein EV04_0267 [Prochlorococcus marinus str. LG]